MFVRKAHWAHPSYLLLLKEEEGQKNRQKPLREHRGTLTVYAIGPSGFGIRYLPKGRFISQPAPLAIAKRGGSSQGAVNHNLPPPFAQGWYC